MNRLPVPGFSPKSDFRIPAEFEEQEYIVIGCGQMIRHYPQTFVDLVRLLHERVRILGVAAPSMIPLGRVLLGTAGLPEDAVEYLPLQTSSMWVRDFAPIGAVDRSGRRFFLKFRQNHMRNRDDVGAADLFRTHLSGTIREVPINMEGGNLLSNGAGFGLSSKTIISQNAQRFSHPELSEQLERWAGISQWACCTPLNAERTGHIDLLASFLAPTLVSVGRVDPRDDPNNASILDDIAKALDGHQTGAGKLRVVRAPMPYSGDTYFRSYQNLIFANGRLILPSYPRLEPKRSLEVKALYSEWLPDWEVVSLDCEEISKKGGSLHCLTTNVPASVAVARRDVDLEARERDRILPR